MKLALHLGFHKTASTHLQGVLASATSGFDNLRYVSPLEFRAKTVWFGSRHKGLDQKNSAAYLAALSNTNGTVIISDENICGHSDDIFRHQRLYEHIFGRLQTLSSFCDRFDTTDVWVVIRNPATFIPSIYCEAMRWKGYEDFSRVFKGDYQQAWLPIIRDIRHALPNSNINVLCYEHYNTSILGLFENIGLSTKLFEDHRADIIRQSPSWRSIKTYKQVSHILPARLQKRLLPLIERLDKLGSEKFMPFSRSEIRRLNNAYAEDIACIKKEPKVSFVGCTH